jgi:hypothetical protein
METSGIRKHKIMDVLRMQYGGFDKVGCTTRDIYNFCHMYKKETIAAGDAQTVIRHMTARQERDPGFFFKYLVDEDGHLKGLFWSDSQSRRDYEAFGDVVVFDSTYRTNKYNLPFVPFVGLNHHRSTVIFGKGSRPPACARPRCAQEEAAGEDEQAKIEGKMRLLRKPRSQYSYMQKVDRGSESVQISFFQVCIGH